MGVYPQPEDLERALDALSQDTLAVVAGGADFYPARVGQPLDDDVLDDDVLDEAPPAEAVATALGRGLAAAEAMVGQGSIAAALLSLQGATCATAGILEAAA